MSGGRLEDRIVGMLDEFGSMERSALATKLDEKPQVISRALYGLKQLGIVRPIGGGRWASCCEPTDLEPPPALPEGEGQPAVRRVTELEPNDDLEDPPETRVRVDPDDLGGCLFNAEGILRRALDEWLSHDPVARQLTAAIRACQAAKLAVDEMTA